MYRIAKISKSIKPFFKGSKGSHDLEHTMRVVSDALHIAKKEKANINIVHAAALLHDIARGIEDKRKGKICHAKLGAELCEKILLRCGYNSAEITKIKNCIATHRFRSDVRPVSLEEKVLFDADKLDSIGAVGIARAFLFAGEVGAKLHNPRPDILKTKPYTKEDTAYREYMVKLRHVKNHIYTKTGKSLAKERHKFMVNFFKELDKEVSGVR